VKQNIPKWRFNGDFCRSFSPLVWQNRLNLDLANDSSLRIAQEFKAFFAVERLGAIYRDKISRNFTQIKSWE